MGEPLVRFPPPETVHEEVGLFEPGRAGVQMAPGRGLRAYLGKVQAIALKELRVEWRAREVSTTMVVFGLLAAIIFGMAFDLRVPTPRMVVPGILWVIVLFTGVVGLHRSFGAEVDRDTLAGLLLAPMDRSAIYFGKLLANLLYLLMAEALLLPALLILFDTNLFQPTILVGLLLGSLGYAEVGTLFAALTAHSRAREALLPVLLLPVMVPVFIAGASLTAGVLDGAPGSGVGRWIAMLVLYDLLFVVAAYLLFDLIWEA